MKARIIAAGMLAAALTLPLSGCFDIVGDTTDSPVDSLTDLVENAVEAADQLQDVEWDKLSRAVVRDAATGDVVAEVTDQPTIEAAFAPFSSENGLTSKPENAEEYKPGQELTAELFSEGTLVDVTGTTKGKGFAGTIKRWGFKSYRRTHGSHKNERRPGSVGACATPSRILKGKRMAGRMGHETNTVLSLTIVSSDVENGILAIKGAIPGPKGGIVLVRSAVKGA